MDVGNPSNMERLRALFGDRDLNTVVRSVSVTDDQIEQEIRTHSSRFGAAICPHTATACYAYRQLDDEERRMKDWIVVATAHAAKFEQIVEPLTGQELPLPGSLKEMLERPVRSVSIEPDLSSFDAALRSGFHLDDSRAAGHK
jgi:threonine synthase